MIYDIIGRWSIILAGQKHYLMMMAGSYTATVVDTFGCEVVSDRSCIN